MKKLANISQFESLMNSTSNPICQNAVFNDGGYWDWDGWHSYSEVPPVDPDDGWNYLRRTDPELFLECEMTSPDDGWNQRRLSPSGRYLYALTKFKDLIKGRIRDVMSGVDEDKILPVVKTLVKEWKGGEWLKERGYKLKFDQDKYWDYADRWWDNYIKRQREKQQVVDDDETKDMDVFRTIEYYLDKNEEHKENKKDDLFAHEYYMKKKAYPLFWSLDRNQRGKARESQKIKDAFGDPYGDFFMFARWALEGGHDLKYDTPPMTLHRSQKQCTEYAAVCYQEMSDLERAAANMWPEIHAFASLCHKYREEKEQEESTAEPEIDEMAVGDMIDQSEVNADKPAPDEPVIYDDTDNI